MARTTTPDTTAVRSAGRENDAVLTHVVVDMAGRGSGAGRLLVSEFTLAAKNVGASRVRLVTAAESDAGGFYDHLGWSHVGRHAGIDGEVWERYELELR